MLVGREGWNTNLPRLIIFKTLERGAVASCANSSRPIGEKRSRRIVYYWTYWGSFLVGVWRRTIKFQNKQIVNRVPSRSWAAIGIEKIGDTHWHFLYMEGEGKYVWHPNWAVAVASIDLTPTLSLYPFFISRNKASAP